jgi:hypothetical protein
MSRNHSVDMEWKLNTAVFTVIEDTYGPLFMDLFASRLNHQLQTYTSFLPDPNAIAVDVFSLNWNLNINYAFPPFSLIAQVLKKLEQDQGQLVLIAPLWTTQPWCTKLLQMVCADSYLLPVRKNILMSPTDPTKLHRIKKPQTCGVSFIREIVGHTGISKHATEILISSWRQLTQKQHRVHLARWL